jgi:transmembrane 9 superfamily protein 3
VFFKQIIQVNLTQDNLQPIKAGKVLEFTYAVEWVETNTTFAHRFDAYLDYPFFEHQVNPICSLPLTPSPS